MLPTPSCYLVVLAGAGPVCTVSASQHCTLISTQVGPLTCNAAAGLVAGVKTGNNLRTAFSCVRDSSPPRGGDFPRDAFPPGLRGLPD